MSIIRTYSKSDLAQLYEVSPDTLTRWLKRASKKHSGLEELFTEDNKRSNLYTPAQVQLIFLAIGEPPEKEEE